ncbi:GNAT family N-acetyltransferase [Saccharopolyspora taberi]|uniref:GNAT family N-acetyltransferase n=1 Tax=Saccharopolyspora taberi TaxID=60895 RepID=A0ABN3VEL7_9PSEU
MELFLETERLLLRRMTDDDLDELSALHNDPDVMRYLNGGKPVGRAEIESWLGRVRELYARYEGYGYWPAIERSTGAFLGWFLLRPKDTDEPGHVELGYRLHRSAWGRGYATEGSLALLRKAFDELGAHRVYAHTMVVNHASRRVMEKIGLHHVRTFDGDFPEPIEGSEHGEVEYAMDLAGWAARR